MTQVILSDEYSMEELDVLWRKKDFEKIISYSMEKYKELIESVGEINFHSINEINVFFKRFSDIDNERFLKYLDEVDIKETELKIFLLKHINSSMEDLAKSMFNKEYVPYGEIFRLIEICYDYEQDTKKSLGYLMRIINTAGNIRPNFGYYVYKYIVEQYINKLSYFEKRKVNEKRKANDAGTGIFGPKDILDVLDSFTNILQNGELEIDDDTANEIFTESAEEIIAWGGTDTAWIGFQLSKLCQGLLTRKMYIPMYKLITDYYEYNITHKHSYILEIMKNVSDGDILWDCIARMENYIKQNRAAKGFKLSVEPARELLKKIITDVLSLIQNKVLLNNMIARYKGVPYLDEGTIKKELRKFNEYLVLQRDKIEIVSSKEILDILYELTGDYKDLFYEFDGGDAYLDALYYEYHNCRQYKLDYFYEARDFDIFQYEKLEEEVLSCRNKVVISYVKDLRDEYLEKLENSSSEKEYDLLRDQLINQIAKLINKDMNNVIYEGIYNRKKMELIKIFNSEENWLKLNEKTRDFLITGEIVFEQLINLGDKVDYSAAVIPLTKALENELYIYFHEKLESYCVANSLRVPTLVDEVNNLSDKYFSLGSIHYYLKHNEYHRVALNYLPTEFKGSYIKPYTFLNNGYPILNAFSKDIKIVRKQYRNKVAHKDGIDKETAESCRDHMLLVEKILLKFINDKK